MKKLFLHISLLFSLLGFAQNEQLAEYYYDKGDFEKAKAGYEVLLKAIPHNQNYFFKTIECYQKLKQFDIAEKSLETRFRKYTEGAILVALGYNSQLQKQDEKAKSYFEKALDRIRSNPDDVYSIALEFEKKMVFDYALKAYQLAVKLNPNYNFNFQIGLIYGQMGNITMMIESFLDEAFAHPENTFVFQQQFSRFMADEADGAFSNELRKAIMVRTQKNQDLFWNQFLSWFYIQQKEYSKAFVQEKAIYKRNQGTLMSFLNLAQLALEEKDEETAKQIFNYILENTTELELVVQTHVALIQLRIAKAPEKDWIPIEKELDSLTKKYELSHITLSLRLIQAHFLAFNLKKTAEAKDLINKILELPLNQYEIAKVKMELADILLSEEKFNQALLYYAQIESELENDAIAHEASLKSAKTSYFKADLDWALKQFKELKSANTQLIANDALEYFLLINDNTVADSTQTALKAFAKADYLFYQKRNQQAIKAFQAILQDFKGQEIEVITLLRLGKIYENTGEFSLAVNQYQTIIAQHSDGIYMDEALFFSAELYKNQLQLPDKAKELYEKIIFNHQDSIYFVEARRKYRELRGETNF